MDRSTVGKDAVEACLLAGLLPASGKVDLHQYMERILDKVKEFIQPNQAVVLSVGSSLNFDHNLMESIGSF